MPLIKAKRGFALANLYRAPHRESVRLRTAFVFYILTTILFAGPKLIYLMQVNSYT